MTTLFRLPLMIRGVVYAAAIFATVYLACLAWDFDSLYRAHTAHRLSGWLAVTAVISLLMTAAALGADVRSQREFGSTKRYVAYRQALRSGRLPSRIDTTVWRGWLVRTRGSHRLGQGVAYLALVLVAVPGLARQPAHHPVFAALVALLASWRLLTSGPAEGRIIKLGREIERRAGAGVTPDEANLAVWLSRPWATRILLPAAMAAGGAFTVAYVDRLYDGSVGPLDGLLAWAAVVGAAVAGRVALRTHPRFPSLEQFFAYNRALNTGDLPAHVEPEVWRDWLRTSLRSNRVDMWWSALLVVLGLLPSVFGESVCWVTASSFGLLAIRNLLAWRRRQRAFTGLASLVEQRAGMR